MTVQPFLRWPDKRLRTAVPDVEKVTDDIRAIWDDMADTMYAMPGVGLAGPQIGVMQRIAVVDCSDGHDQLVRMANPVIVEASRDMFEWDEASPNLPGLSARIKRPRAVVVSYLDHHGFRVRKDFKDLWATSVQHQIDHLDGKMFFDRLGRVSRDRLLKKAGLGAKGRR